MAVKFFGTLCALFVVVIVLNKVRLGSAIFFQFPSSISISRRTNGPIYSVFSKHLTQPHFFNPPATTPLPKTLIARYNAQPPQGWSQPLQGWGQPARQQQQQGWGRPQPISNGWGQPSNPLPQIVPHNSAPEFEFLQSTDLLRTLPIITQTRTEQSKSSKTGKKQPKKPAASIDDAEVIENDDEDETPAPVAASSSNIRSSLRNRVQGRSGKQRALNRTPKSRINSNRGRGLFDSRPDPFERQVNGGYPAEGESEGSPPANNNDIPAGDGIIQDENPADDDSAQEVNPEPVGPSPPKKNRNNNVNPIFSSNNPIDDPSQVSLQDAIKILVRVADQLQRQQSQNNPQSQFGGSSFGGRNNNNPQQAYGAPSSNNFQVSNQNQFQFQPLGGFNDRPVRNTDNFRTRVILVQQRPSGSRRNGEEPAFEIIKALGSEELQKK